MDNEDISKHHCTSCMNQARDVLFSCVECKDFSLCLQCYVYGTEIGPHKRDHEVKMIDLGTFSIFKTKKHDNNELMETDDLDQLVDDEVENIEKDNRVFEKFLNEELGKEFTENHVIKETQTQLPARMDTGQEEYEWRAMDEKALFEALLRVGYGNWKDVANYINTTLGTNISPAEVERHYNIHYINGLIGRLCWTWMFTDSVVRQLSRFPFTIRGNHDKLQPNKDDCSNLFRDIPQSELDSLGYLPKRDDFEREFDNEAETLISNLTLGAENEDDIEKKFKLAQIDIYQRRLISRFRKKLIIRVNELIKLFLEVHKNEIFKDSLQARRDSNSKLFKDFQEKYPMFMPFVRYLRKQDLNSLYQDIAIEQVLKILLKKIILFSVLSTNNLDKLKKEDKIKMIQLFNKAINKRIEQNNNSVAAGGNVCDGKNETNNTDNNNSIKLSSKSTKNDSLDVEDLEDMDEMDIIDMIFADENPIDRDCLNQIINHESIQSLSRLTADFIQKSDDKEFMKEAFKYFNQQQSSYWKQQQEETTSTTTTTENNDTNLNNVFNSPKKKMKIDSDNMESESIAHTLSELETNLCMELKIDAALFVEMKNVLIKQHKKYPKASRHRLNFENIINKNYYGREHLDTLRRIHNHLIANGELSSPAMATSSNSVQ